MTPTEEKREAVRLLGGLEDGRMTTDDAQHIAGSVDPVLLYFIVRHLRDSYPASDPAATSVLDRVVGLTRTSPLLVTRCKEGQEDPVSKWFEGDYSFRDFRGRGVELIEMIADKLEA